MFNDYLVYQESSSFLLTRNPTQKKDFFTEIIRGDEACLKMLQQSAPPVAKRVLLECTHPGHVMCEFIESRKVILAGGGMVRNSQGQLLMIYRKGHWDLPKGKIELRESIAEGAIREVWEETGIRAELLDDKPVYTYHTYNTEKESRILKETQWFHMNAVDHSPHVPQQQEEITHAVWLNRQQIEDILPQAYPMIQDLIRKYFL